MVAVDTALPARRGEHLTGPLVGGEELYRGILPRYPYLAHLEMPPFDLRPPKSID